MANKKNNQNPVNGRFVKGNVAAKKWDCNSICAELQKIIDVLAKPEEEGGGENNIVRANSIKYAEEAVLCTDVCLNSWEYWNTAKFQETLPKDSPVFVFLKRIKKICELRLSYSGKIMDIFHLKNHYGYVDKSEKELKVEQTGVSGFILEE